MADSLQEQLLKAGLVDGKKLKQAKKDNYKQQKQAKHHKTLDQSKAAMQRTQVEQVERDRELNRQRQEALQLKAIAAQIKQLIENYRQPREGGETPYNFSDLGRVKRLYVTSDQHGRLSRGSLAIVKFADQYELVPADVAEKIKQRDEGCVIVCNKPEQQDAGDDPYADFQVPDDLLW